MLKKILALAALLFSLSSFAAVDVNKASAAELDGIKGIWAFPVWQNFERTQQRQFQRLARSHAPRQRHGREKFSQVFIARADSEWLGLPRRQQP